LESEEVRPLALLALILSIQVLRAQEYVVTFVDKFTERNMFFAEGLSPRGEIGGTSQIGGRQVRATVWLAGKYRRLEGFGFRTDGNGINDRGQLTGSANRTSDQGAGVPCFWESDGRFVPLDVPFRGTGWHIADSGAISGEAFLSGVTRVFFWENGEYRILPSLGRGPTSFPFAMNNRKTVVGYELGREGSFVGSWIWSPERGFSELPGFIAPWDINDQGTILFTSAISRDAGLWNGLSYRRLSRGTFRFVTVNKLNNFETVAGDTTEDGISRIALIWRTPTSEPVPLDALIDPSLRLRISKVYDINDAGQILAAAESTDGLRTSYVVRLDPRVRSAVRAPLP
jgi:hypothetical protein